MAIQWMVQNATGERKRVEIVATAVRVFKTDDVDVEPHPRWGAGANEPTVVRIINSTCKEIKERGNFVSTTSERRVAKELYVLGASINRIARALGRTWPTIAKWVKE